MKVKRHHLSLQEAESARREQLLILAWRNRAIALRRARRRLCLAAMQITLAAGIVTVLIVWSLMSAT